MYYTAKFQLKKIARATHQVSIGNFHVNLSKQRKDEIGDVAK
jgi:HAMP domain-containing protein